MPHPDDFSSAALGIITREIGLRLPLVLGPRLQPGTAVTITASLQVWEVTAGDLATILAVDLVDLARPTGRWHHQIAVNGEPELYARSGPPVLGAGPPELYEVVRSPLAGRLDAAITLADRTDVDDDVARLLEAVEYHVWALWLRGPQGQGRVVVVDSPFDLGLPTDQLVPDRELVARLRQLRPIVGVRPD